MFCELLYDNTVVVQEQIKNVLTDNGCLNKKIKKESLVGLYCIKVKVVGDKEALLFM